MSNRWKGMFLPVSKPTHSSVAFEVRLRVFFRTESYTLIGTNWYLSTCSPSCQSLNFYLDFFVKYFYFRTQCLKGHPKRCRTVIPMSPFFSASLSNKFVTDASWLVPTTLTEVTSGYYPPHHHSFSPDLNRRNYPRLPASTKRGEHRKTYRSRLVIQSVSFQFI